MHRRVDDAHPALAHHAHEPIRAELGPDERIIGPLEHVAVDGAPALERLPESALAADESYGQRSSNDVVSPRPSFARSLSKNHFSSNNHETFAT